MANFFDKMMNKLNIADEEEYEYDQYDEYSETEEESVDDYNSSTGQPRLKTVDGGKSLHMSSSKVVNFQANVQMEVVVIQPNTYDEAQVVCDHVISKRPVIVNLENMEHSIAQRIMDFISGSCYTLNGSLQRVTHNIFIITPENVEIAGDLNEELKSNGIILPWKSE